MGRIMDSDGGNIFNTWACGAARHWDCRNSWPTPKYCAKRNKKEHYSTWGKEKEAKGKPAPKLPKGSYGFGEFFRLPDGYRDPGR